MTDIRRQEEESNSCCQAMKQKGFPNVFDHNVLDCEDGIDLTPPLAKKGTLIIKGYGKGHGRKSSGKRGSNETAKKAVGWLKKASASNQSVKQQFSKVPRKCFQTKTAQKTGTLTGVS